MASALGFTYFFIVLFRIGRLSPSIDWYKRRISTAHDGNHVLAEEGAPAAEQVAPISTGVYFVRRYLIRSQPLQQTHWRIHRPCALARGQGRL